jgi:trans-aconitate 2-methyltransferase
VAEWEPEKPVDLLFANAVFQWVPEHPAVMRRLVELLPEGGVLAAQRICRRLRPIPIC